MTTLKTVGRQLLPPVLIEWMRHIFGDGIHFQGDFASWEEASKQSSGYDASEILRRVREASLKVKQGEAVFERDGVCFFQEEYSWEVLACLMLSAAQSHGKLNVLDYGGALGSFYFQHRKFFSGLNDLRWGVVEQKHYVECGRSEFQDERLRFYFAVEKCFEDMPVNAILLSSVLQYLEKPYELLFQLAGRQVNNLIVTRTPFTKHDSDKLVIQRVSKKIFPAKLPMWIFSEKVFDREMSKLGYSRKIDFSCAEGSVGKIRFSGILYSRKEP